MAGKALGTVETVGLVAALAGADAGAKAAGVGITRRLNTRGGGMIVVIFEGEVAAVEAAVEAATAAARAVGKVAAAHVIARPVDSLGEVLGTAPPPKAPSRRRRAGRQESDSGSDNGG